MSAPPIPPPPVWRGSAGEFDRLVRAVLSHCERFDHASGTAPDDCACPAHQLLLDQATMDRLAYVSPAMRLMGQRGQRGRQVA